MAALTALWMLASPAPAPAATLERDPFVIHYEPGDGGAALETAAVLTEAVQLYGQRLPVGKDPIHVYIADTMDRFQEYAGDVPTRQIEGFARSAEGIIVLRSPRLLQPGANYAAIARHELLHVLLARTADPDHLPRWLNEGIAMFLSREGRWSNSLAMAQMYTGNRVIDYDNLPYVFNAPGNELEFGDAYTQSLSMTRYLRKQLGENAFWDMVAQLDERPFDEALVTWLQVTPREFYGQWRRSLWRTAVVASLVTGFSLFQLAAILAIAAYLHKRRRARRTMQRWDEEAKDEIAPDPF